MKCVVVIPFCMADQSRANRLIGWIKELGGCLENSLLLVSDGKTKGFGFVPFNNVEEIRTPFALPDESHPRGANWMFETAMKHLQNSGNKLPILWLEPDAVPLRRGWLQEIEREYSEAKAAGKQILACVTKLGDEKYPKSIPSGTAVYPPNAWSFYSKLAINRKIAWDIQFADKVIPVVYPSKTIFNVVNHKSPPTFKAGGLELFDIPKTAALWHPCKDDSLITLLREQRKPKRSQFYHSGDLGDIIYSMVAMRELGGGEVFLGPDNQTTFATREKMTPQRAAAIIPLLESQGYIHSAKFSELMPPNVKYDMNKMRTLMRTEYAADKSWINIAQIFLKASGLAIDNDKLPWLTIAPKEIAPVVAARSPRYQNNSFRWDRIVSMYRGQMVFVGTAQEHADFCAKFGRIPHEKTKDLHELAQVIAGSKLFVGNQSCPYSIAEGLKKTAILEACPGKSNTIFKRENVTVGVTDKTTLPTISKPTPKKLATEDALVIRGPVDNFSGFGQIIQAITLGLNARGISAKVSPSQISNSFQPDIPPIPKAYQELMIAPETPAHVIISMHCSLPKLVKGGEVVMTMWESTRISPETCDALNKAGHVIVPSTWSAISFNACGVDTQISIVPLGIDTSIYRPRRCPKGKPFTFGTAGRVAHGGIRKGIDEVMAAFIKAFPTEENVRLEIKCYQDCPVKDLGDKRISLHREFLPNLSSWYSGLHCFVSASRGEGWGLQPHQAMGIGRPVIAPQFGGLSAFFDDSCGWPVEFDLKPASGSYEGKGIWAEVSIDDLASKMRYAFEHQEEAIEKGKSAALRAAKFSTDHMVDCFEKSLRKAGIL